jgi:hypothetical protein
VRTVPRTRHYVSPGALTLCRPLLSFDYTREAYVLRGIGPRIGPVLREDRRRSAQPSGYTGPERRGFGRTRLRAAIVAAGLQETAAGAVATDGGTSQRAKDGGQPRGETTSGRRRAAGAKATSPPRTNGNAKAASRARRGAKSKRARG